MTWRVFLAALLAVLPVLIVSTTPAHACTCARLSFQEKVERADLIVLGTTVRVRDGIITLSNGDEYDALVTSVAVDGYLKGIGPPTLEHSAPRGGAACQYFPEIGDRNLLLLSSRDDGSYSTSTCAGNMNATFDNEERVQARVTEIGQLLYPGTDVADLPPLAPPIGSDSRDILPGVLLATAAFGALLAVGALVFARRPG